MRLGLIGRRLPLLPFSAFQRSERHLKKLQWPEIDTLELLQTLAANTAAPFILCSKLAEVAWQTVGFLILRDLLAGFLMFSALFIIVLQLRLWLRKMSPNHTATLSTSAPRLCDTCDH